MNPASVIFDPEIIARFDVKGPRYTSYPTADRFHSAFNTDAYRSALSQPSTNPLSLYIHVPFCRSICYYCACNRIITADQQLSRQYVDYVGREMSLLAQYRAQKERVTQLHWGGGSPNFLSHAEMRHLMAHTREHFDLAADGEFSIEIDPRQVSKDTVVLLRELGFNRMSIGVQDFDPAVQQAIHRVQSEEETAGVIHAARDCGFASISIDLIYGLPRQTLDGFARTLNRVIALRPDRISVYNFAFLPALFSAQRRLNESELPAPDTRLRILAHTVEQLTTAGYVYIGMDHFALPDDELTRAQQQGRLRRNFQGYSTHADCDLLAFGVSAISQVGPAYAQNYKTLDEYYERIDRHILPVARGMELTADDLIRRALIQTLMCHFVLDTQTFENEFAMDFWSYFAPEREYLHELAAAGLVELTERSLIVLPAGRLLVRAIAMTFDRHLREDRQKNRYSKLI